MRSSILTVLITLALSHAVLAAEDHIPSGYKLLYEQKFEQPDSLKEFQPTDPSAWKYSKEASEGALAMAAHIKYMKADSSSGTFSSLKDIVFGIYYQMTE